MQSLFSSRWVYKSSREFAIKTKNKDVLTNMLRGTQPGISPKKVLKQYMCVYLNYVYIKARTKQQTCTAHTQIHHRHES